MAAFNSVVITKTCYQFYIPRPTKGHVYIPIDLCLNTNITMLHILPTSVPSSYIVEPSLSTHKIPKTIQNSNMPSSTLQYFNQFMERRKPKGSIDELAIIKAAAWAWYQRGSRFEGTLVPEYDATRTTRVRKPSRYKLEAMRKAQEEEVYEVEIGLSQRSSRSVLSPSHIDNSLLNRYEIERISKELEYYVESSNTADHNNGGFVEDDCGGRRSFSLLESKTSGLNGMKKNKKKKGFWVLGHGMACGSRDDVVENIGVHRRRRSERNGQVAEAANHRGLAAHA